MEEIRRLREELRELKEEVRVKEEYRGSGEVGERKRCRIDE